MATLIKPVLSKIAFDRILGLIRVGAVEVDYWGEETKVYGRGKPNFKLVINNPRAIRSILKNNDLGFGEAYMSGDVDVVGDLEELGRITSQNTGTFSKLGWRLRGHKLQPNTKDRQPKQIQHHYDLGNNFYEMWLDRAVMAYTCAYYRQASDTLEQAQTQKIDHVLRKLQLQKGQTLVDMGCGWGHLVIRAAQEYGVQALGVTLSREQLKHATTAAKAAGVEKLARFELLNYQDLADRDVQYDRVVSVGLLEHVGRGNHKTYFKTVDKLLKPGGVSVLHSITNQTEEPIPAWLDKYIFPGGYIPALREIVELLPEYGFWLTDYENLRLHYAMTCSEWLRRFDAHKDEVIKMYDERFYRMWRLYLAMSASSFRYGENNLSQLVFTKGINNDLPLTREFLYKQ